VKQVLLLFVAAALLLGAWWAVEFFSAEARPRISAPADPQDRAALLRAVQQLWSATPNHYDPLDVLDFLARVERDLEEAQWRSASAPVLFAWKNHRDIAGVRHRLVALNEKLIPRLVRTVAFDELPDLIRVANERRFDADRVNAELEKSALAPLPASGFRGSRAAEVVAAAVWAGDVARAASYLERIAGTDPFVAKTRAAFLAGQEATPFDVEQAVPVWDAHDGDPVGVRVYRPALEAAGVRLILSDEPRGDGPLSAEKLDRSLRQPRADAFWRRVTERTLPSLIDGDERKLGRVAPFLKLCEAAFKSPGYAFDLLLRAALMAEARSSEDPLRAVALLARAEEFAGGDRQRADVARLRVAAYSKAREFAQALDTAKRAHDDVRDPGVKADLAELLKDAKKKSADDEARVAQQVKSIEQDRARGRLLHMKESLNEARKNGQPAAEIAELEKAVRQLEAAVSE
jgi:hypothetical protein